jgi:dTDP-4-dehydrorhamnose 3,5-epimerase
MKVTPTKLPEVLLIEPKVFADERGFFMETWNQRAFDEAVGEHVRFVQDNHSRSTLGVLRGLHYQLPPHAQGKLVRVTNGRVFDVAVDIRKSSPRFGQWAAAELSDENYRQMWIPAGFAHGFLVVSESADFLYKTTDYYAPSCEAAVCWNDPGIGIHWPLDGLTLVLSDKDRAAPEIVYALAFD